jgi:hypothetical protein
MATFPALVPSSAPITPGAWPVTTTSSLNGAEARIRHGSKEIGRTWRPSFVNISEADFLAIVAHYRGQRSGFDSFGFSTTTLAADLTPSGHAWLYASRPQVVDEHLDCFTVQCEFRAEPRGLVVAPGNQWRTPASTFTPGSRSGGVMTVNWITGSTTFIPGLGLSPSARLVMYFDGANNSTTFTDSSANALTITPYVNAKISTAQSAFGGTSGYFDGSSYLRIDDGSWAALNTTATIEMRFYASSLSSSSEACLISKDTYGVNFSWCIFLKNNGIKILTDYTTQSVVCSVAVPTLEWCHVKVTNTPGSGIKVWLNGALVSPTNSVNLTNDSGKVTIGCTGWNAPGNFFAGYIDELRIY